MFTRYEQDLSPFFARIRAKKLAQRAERRRRRRESLQQLLSLLKIRRPESRRG